ncbi:11205_t:CDS:2 [Rhizophagus irregularis]|nr:11205_t:CDS:2 [Rhizophagus irregularis]
MLITQQDFLNWTKERPKDVWRKYSNNILMIDNLMKLLNVKEEVLLIRHLLPVPLFPSKGTTDYPLINVGENKAQSTTFHIITNYHHDAIKLLNGTFNLNTWVSMKTLNYLFNEFPLQGSGIQGIFDELILTNSNSGL